MQVDSIAPLPKGFVEHAKGPAAAAPGQQQAEENLSTNGSPPLEERRRREGVLVGHKEEDSDVQGPERGKKGGGGKATTGTKYGYDDAAPHETLLRVQSGPDRVLIVLEDDRHEFNPLTAPPPDLNLPVEKPEAGALGIQLVRQLPTQMDYQRCNGRNRLTVRIST